MNKLLPLILCTLLTTSCAVNINGSNRRSTPRFTGQHIYLIVAVVMGGAYLIDAISRK